jgi:hypothetical protein
MFHFCGVCCFLTVWIYLLCYFVKSLFVDALYSSSDKLRHICNAELQTFVRLFVNLVSRLKFPAATAMAGWTSQSI